MTINHTLLPPFFYFAPRVPTKSLFFFLYFFYNEYVDEQTSSNKPTVTVAEHDNLCNEELHEL